jgi:MFS family permease
MNCIIGFVVTAAVLKIFRGPGERRRETFDLWGAIVLLIGYPSLLIGLTLGANLGRLWATGWFVLAVAGLASFFWIELHTTNPLVDIKMFTRPMLAGALGAVVLSHTISNPIALVAPLYLQNVLGATAMTSGLLLAVLPLSTAIASPLGGRLADRIEAAKVAVFGLALIVGGIAAYSRLAVDSEIILVAAVLALLGAGIGLFTPANQKVAFAAVAQGDYGVLGAMLSSFGTAAGTIGTTIAVALMEIDGGRELWTKAVLFAEAQQFAFMWLVLAGLAGVAISLSQLVR